MMERRVGILEKIGVIGILICGAGVGGPDSITCLGLTVIFMLVAAFGYKFHERSERNKAAEKAKQRPKDKTFETWIKCCGMAGPFRG